MVETAGNGDVCACAVPEPQQLSSGVWCAECARPIHGAVTETQRFARSEQPIKLPVELQAQHLRPGSRYAMVALDTTQGFSGLQLFGITEAWRRFVEGETGSLVIDGTRYAIVEVPEGAVLDPVVATRADPKNAKVVQGEVVVPGAIPHEIDRVHAVRWVAELRAFVVREVQRDVIAAEGPKDPVREVMVAMREMGAENARFAKELERRESVSEALAAMRVLGMRALQAFIGLAALLGMVWAWERFAR